MTKGRCLVLMPFHEPFISRYDRLLAPTIREAGYEPVRGDHIYGTTAIPAKVTEAIERSAVIVADISDDNANVNYEVGIAHTLGRPVVILSRGRSLPFYYAQQSVRLYDENAPDFETTIQASLRESLRHATASHAPFAGNQNLGLFNYFPNDGEAFRNALLRTVDGAARRVAFIGWGLAFVADHTRTLMNAIKRGVEESSSLEAHIMLPVPDHPGLVVRIQEERTAQSAAIVENWPNTFFKFAQELLDVAPEARPRVFVRHLSFLPTAAVLQIDDLYFFRPYGPPNRGGWASPWLACDTTQASASWADYLKNFVDFAIRDAALHARET